MRGKITCIVCPLGCAVSVQVKGKSVVRLEGARCRYGRTYARKEALHPVRTLTSTVCVKGQNRVVPVRSSKPIPKGKILRCMNALARLEVKPPIHAGQILVKNILRSGADIIATRDVPNKR